MSSLAQLREGLSQAFENVSEGWHHLRQRTSQALTRFNPIRHRDEVETPEDQAMLQGSRWGLLAAEIEEKKDEIIVRLEAPGMESGDFDLSVIDENYLVVRGEKRAQREKSHGHYYMLECAYGRFERAFELPAPVEEDKARAKYKRGVLTVHLPKAKHAKRRRIEVQVV